MAFMRPVLIALSLTIPMVFSACKTDVPMEQEPNDTFSEATPIKIDSLIRGALSTRDDIDIYRLEVRYPSVLNIGLSPVRGVNHAFKIWKGSDQPVLIKYIDDMRKSSPENFANLFVDSGVYYISVEFGERDVPVALPEAEYRLEIKSRTWFDEEKEPNDNPENAAELYFEREIKGYFSPAYNRLNRQGQNQLREEDWYFLDIELPGEKPMLLDVGLTGVRSINSIIEVFTPELEKIASADDGGAHEGESISDLGIKNTGRYYIMVASKNFESNNDQEYRLMASLRAFDSGMEMEPNDDFSAANVMTGNEISGKIHPQGDQDVFLYRGEEHGLYRVELTPPDSLDLVLEILDEDETKIYEADNGAQGIREVVPAIHLNENFFIKVRSKKTSSNPNETYKLSITPIDRTEEYEIEPNDTKEKATPLKREMIKGFTSKHRDRDYFLLNYNNMVKKTFTIKAPPDSELKVSITDPLGFVIRSEGLKGAGKLKFTEMIDQKAFVIIDALKENYDEPYILQVTEAK